MRCSAIDLPGRTSGAVQIDQPLSYAWQTAT
jgi:hypothetical protein